MKTAADAYPLAWPEGRKRTPAWRREKARFGVSFASARDNVVREVHLLAGKYPDPLVIISTMIALRRDGLPLANQRQPDDVGVAVYFTYKKTQRCFACDRWTKVEHNMQAIAKTIEALRGIKRWGTGDMLEAAFSGFTALPAPASAVTWRDVLSRNMGVDPGDIRTIEQARDLYRRQAAVHHPDRGGSMERMVEINRAWGEAQLELS